MPTIYTARAELKSQFYTFVFILYRCEYRVTFV